MLFWIALISFIAFIVTSALLFFSGDTRYACSIIFEIIYLFVIKLL